MSVASASRPDLLMTWRYPDWDLGPMEADYNVLRLFEAEDAEAFLSAHGAAVRAVATAGVRGASADLIARLPKLEIISVYGVGYDAVDVEAARLRGIRVTNTPDVLTGDVADLAVGLALAAARRIPAADAYVRAGRWAAAAFPLTARLCGKRVGVVGLGRIGAAVARRFAGFDCEVAYFGRSAKAGSPYRFEADLVALAAWSDYLVVTLAGGPSSRNIVDAAVLAALGPTGFLVNVSRGTTVDEPALIAALEAGAIAGAGLDVFLNEPAIDPRFFALDNVVLQPHHASATVETRRAMGQLVRDNLAAHFAGRPLPSAVA